MNEIATVLSQNLLPILVIASFGYALQRWKSLDKRVLSTVTLYILSPCLVFSSLVGSQLPGEELLSLAAFAAITVAVMGLIALAVATILRFRGRERAALILLVMFANGGNFGLTLVTLRYGQAGLSRAVVYYTTSTIILYTVGLFIASTGHLTVRGAARRLLGLPPLYAALAAILVYGFQLAIPTPILRAIEIAGNGAIPVMLIILGMQMADLHGGINFRLATPAVVLRLFVGPLVGLTVAGFLGLQGLSRSTSIIETAMPSAVVNTLLATEFELNAPLVTGIVVVSTLISPITITLIIVGLGL